MLTMSLRGPFGADATTSTACAPIPPPPAPPAPDYIDIPPFLMVSVKDWEKAAADGKPLLMTVDLDPRKAFYGIPPELLAEARDSLYPKDFKGTIADFTKASLANAPKLVPILRKYAGYGPTPDIAMANAEKLARALISKEIVLQLYYRLSRKYLKLSMTRGVGHADGITRDFTPFRLDHKDFVENYRGLHNPYTYNDMSRIYTPLVEGEVMLMEVKPPTNIDPVEQLRAGKNVWQSINAMQKRWILTAKWLGDSKFQFGLYHRNRPGDGILPSLDDFGASIFSVLKFPAKLACQGITAEKLQSIRNTAGAVPEPHTQAAVGAWQAAASACGLIFPAKPTAECAPMPAEEASPPPEQSWLQKNQKYLILGGVGLLGTLALWTVAQRRASR